MTARRRALGALLTVLVVALGMAGCSSAGTVSQQTSTSAPHGTTGTSGTGTSTSSTTPGHAGGVVWIISRTALADVASLDQTALHVLEAGRIYELLSAHQRPVAGVNAIVTQDFTSFAALSAAIQGNLLVPGAQAVLYDPEHWSLTPLSEQEQAATYIGDAVTLAHQHGLQIIVTPGTDLVTVVSPGVTAADEVSRFLSSGIEQAAAAADVVDVQAQSREHDPTTYAAFVLQAASVIHAARAAAVVVAGLSTNPPSGAVTATQLAAAIESVKADVQGFWLNVPKQGNACRTCSSNPDPAAGTGALDAVWGS